MDLSSKDYKIQPTIGIKPANLNVDSDDSTRGWLTLFLGIFLIIIFAVIGLKVYNWSLIKKIDQINIENDNLIAQLDKKNVDKILLAEKRLTIARGAFSSHIYFSNILDLIEKNTLPTIQLANINFDLKNKFLEISGYANDWSFVAKQIDALNRANLLVTDISKLAAEKEKGAIGFSFKTLFNDKDLLK